MKMKRYKIKLLTKKGIIEITVCENQNLAALELALTNQYGSSQHCQVLKQFRHRRQAYEYVP